MVGLIDSFKGGIMNCEGKRIMGNPLMHFKRSGERMRDLHVEPGSFEA
jgi:hypothetical protein